MCATESTTACCPSLSKLSRMWRMKAKVLYTPSQRLWVSTHTCTHTQTHGPTVMTSLPLILWLILLSGLFLLLLDLDDPSWLHPFNSFWLITPPPHCLLFPLSVFHPPLRSLFFVFLFESVTTLSSAQFLDNPSSHDPEEITFMTCFNFSPPSSLSLSQQLTTTLSPLSTYTLLRHHGTR